jgi:iron(III) transport system ATP-binding protein
VPFALSERQPSRSSRTRAASSGLRFVALAALVGVTASIAACREAPPPGQPMPITRVLGSLGDSPGRFMYPRVIDVGADGLWVIDRSARIQRIDTNTGACLGYTRMPDFTLGKPTGLAVAPGPLDDNSWASELLYIADTHYHRVVVAKPPPVSRDPRGTPESPFTMVRTFGSYGRGPGQLYYPTDVAVLVNDTTPAQPRIDRIYVSEYGGNDRINVFDSSGAFLFSFGSFGNSAAPESIQFNRPQQLAIDRSSSPHPTLVVTDSCNHRVGVFTLDGSLIRWIGAVPQNPEASASVLPSTTVLPTGPITHAGPASAIVVGQPARFAYPYGLALLNDSTALISEFGASRIQHIHLRTGITLAAWGKPGRGDGELALPWGVAVDGQYAFALDSANNRVQVFRAPSRQSALSLP